MDTRHIGDHTDHASGTSPKKTDTSYGSYPKIYNMGHAALENLFSGVVTVEEKVDGSQFSFGLIDGDLKMRSRGQQINIYEPNNMFKLATDFVKSITWNLHPNWTYRGEYLQKPKHNALAYERTPKNNIIIFDINIGDQKYLSYDEKVFEATRLGLEVVPIFHYGELRPDMEMFAEWLEHDSVLGGQKIEGFVVKNYSLFGRDGKALMGKHVSENFKEKHAKSWGKSNPAGKDIIVQIVDQLRHDNVRWEKAVQKVRDAGELQDAPQDIGPLMKFLQQDIEEENADEIKEILYNWARKTILRRVSRGFPEWYKNKLLEKQVEEGVDNE